VDRVATVEVACPAAVLFGWVDDLTRYPSWLRLVTRVDADGGSPEHPAWLVELRGRIGPLARSKRLRMVRTRWEPAVGVAAFERDEQDGRQHSAWVLRADVEPLSSEASRLTMRLHYGGRLWGPVLDRLLADEIAAAQARLATLVRPEPRS
jgi:hypothetical protein